MTATLQHRILVFQKRPKDSDRQRSPTFSNAILTTHEPRVLRSTVDDRSCALTGVIIEAEASAPGWLRLAKEVRMARPGTPIWICGAGPDLSAAQLFALPTESMKDIGNWIRDHLSPCEILPAAITKLGDSELPGYVGFPTGDLVADQPLALDVYLRLPTGRALKIANRRSALGAGRAVELLRKGVHALYVRCADLQENASLFKKLERSILSLDPLESGDESRLVTTLNLTDDLAQMLETQAISESMVDEACDLTFQIARTLRSFPDKGKELFQRLWLETQIYNHSVRVTFLALLLARHIGMEVRETTRWVGLAALFHDVGKVGLSDRDYKLHPIRGAQMLLDVGGVESRVIQAVAQHHERRDGSGFPGRLKAGEINRIAEWVGAADSITKEVSAGPPDLGCWLKTNEDLFSVEVLRCVELLSKK